MLVTISGLGTTSDADVGVHNMGTGKEIGKKIDGSKHHFDWDANAIVQTICANLEDDPCQPVVIIGHSLGGDTADEVSEALDKKDICVDLLIQIESVGNEDDTKPDNVEQGVNIFSVGADIPAGEEWVDGSINIGISGSPFPAHSSIDDEDDPGKATPSGQPWDNMSTWEVVAHFVSKLPKKPCNCKDKKSKISMHDAAPIMKAVGHAMGEGKEGASLVEIHKATELKSRVILPQLSKLVKARVLEVAEDENNIPIFRTTEMIKALSDESPITEPNEVEIEVED